MPTVPVNVIFSICGKIVVDDEGNLLDVDTTSEEVGGDQHARRAGTELTHNNITLLLVHVTMLKM